MGYQTDKYIAVHGKGLAIIIAVGLLIWFIAGLIFVDLLPIYIFLPIWLPIGALAGWWSQKW